MVNTINQLLDTLNLYTINKLSFENDNTCVAVEFIDEFANTHTVEFCNVDTYFFLDEDMLKNLYSSVELDGPITYFHHQHSEIVAIDQYEDGSFEEHTLANPNIILSTETASIMMEAKNITINGQRFQLDKRLN